MMDFRPVFLSLGLLLAGLATAMALPAAADAVAGHANWHAFAASGAFTLFVGLALILGSRSGEVTLPLRQAFLVVSLSWVVVGAFAALPLAFSNLQLSATDAFFEAISGITTTGSTVISGLDHASPGILLWRGLLQWLGGIGIIIMAVAVLPSLKIGGMQIFRSEISDPSDRVLPRAAQFASTLAVIYVSLTLLLSLALWFAGMTGLEALIHGMTTISTGGFSTSDASLGHFDSAAIDAVATIGMILGGMPFLLFIHMTQGNARTALRDQQLHWYLGLLAAGTVGVAAWLFFARGLGWSGALHHGLLTVASVMTGTGFFTLNFSDWAGMPLAILFLLTFVGGCAGSTAAGIKVFRIQILFATARAQTKRLLRPHAVYVPYYNRKPIPDDVADSVMGFLFVYVLSFAILAMALAMLGLDFVTAISSAASAIANVGPGLGPIIGPGGSFASLPDPAKWLLAAGMVLGRLEMFTVLVLFVPNFWRP